MEEGEERAWGKRSFDVDRNEMLSPQKVSPIVKATSAVKQEGCLALIEKFASRKLFFFLWEAFGEHNGIHMFLSDPTAAARAS